MRNEKRERKEEKGERREERGEKIKDKASTKRDVKKRRSAAVWSDHMTAGKSRENIQWAVKDENGKRL